MLKKIYINYKLKKRLNSALSRGTENGKALLLIDSNRFDIRKVEAAFQNYFGDLFEYQSLCFTRNSKLLKSKPETFFSPRSFSLLKPNLSEHLIKITQQEYEFVFQFFSNNQVYLNYISAHTKAELRIGFNNSNIKLTDLKLDLDHNDLDLVFEEAKKYLIIINKSA